MTDTHNEWIPKRIAFIDRMMIDRFHTIPISKDDLNITRVMEDPFMPTQDTICGIYCLYRRSVLDVLQGRIASFVSYEFETALASDQRIKEQDVEDVWEVATWVIISSQDNEFISHYFIGGDAKRLNSILHVCTEYTDTLKHKANLKRFNEEVRIVQNMGYLQNIRTDEP